MAATVLPPLIGVTGPRHRGLAPRICVYWALHWAGARTVFLNPALTGSPEPLDGLVVTGGHDVDPVLYAAPREVTPNYDTERDAFESILIEDALARDLPLLGICRGAQLLNVRLGGSLQQDLRTRRVRTSNRRTVLPLKTLYVEPGSLLHRIMGTDRLRINSLHNQGIARVGSGLRVTGRDIDDIVQAVEGTSRPFLLGVQWHPELLLFDRRQRALFQGLVDAAGKRRCAPAR